MKSLYLCYYFFLGSEQLKSECNDEGDSSGQLKSERNDEGKQYWTFEE